MTIKPTHFNWTHIYFMLLFSLVIIRAILVPLIPDEAYTYFLYIETNSFVGQYATVDANNHILNSFLSTLSVKFFGISAFSLRLPNILAFVLFFYSVVRISKFLQGGFSKVVFVFTLNSIFPVLEFFSLSRGYGLSFAFLFFGVYQLLSFMKDGRTWSVIWVLVSCVFILLSQLSLLFASAAMLFVLVVATIRIFWHEKPWFVILVTLLSACVLVFFVLYTKSLQEAGVLYYGAQGNFPFHSISSLNLLIFGFDDLILSRVILLLIVLVSVASVLNVLRQKISLNSISQNLFGAMLLASVLGISISIYFFEGLAPLDRTGLYIYVILVAGLFFLFDKSKHIRLIPFWIGFFFIFSSMRLMQLNHVNHWSHHNIKFELIEVLADNVQDYNSIGVSPPLEHNANFYINHQISFSSPVFPISEEILFYDYVLLTQEDVRKYTNQLQSHIVLFVDTVGVSLFQKEKVKNTKTQRVLQFSQSANNEHLEYIGLGSYFLEDWYIPGNSYFFELNILCKLKRRTNYFDLVVQFFDSSEACIKTQHFTLNRISPMFNKGSEFKCFIPIDDVPVASREMRIFFYNPQNHKVLRFICEGAIVKSF